jgi:hypothetical protein
MKRWFKSTLIVASLALSLSASEMPSGPYLGQTPPGMEARLFAPGIVNTGMFTRDLAMTPDGKEIYFSVVTGQNKLAFIVCTRMVGGRWTEPEILPQLGLAGYSTIEPCISSDGKRFYFSSNRPAPGKPVNPHDFDIWVMERVGDKWGEPANLGEPVNTGKGEYFPSITRDGTLYYTGPEAEGKGEVIWRARPENGGFAKPEMLPPQVNAGRARFNAFVASDESFLIVPVYGMPDSRGDTDYYVTFRNPDGSWSEPKNLGDAVNSDDGNEYSASLSPDGKYLFFMSAHLPKPEEMPRPLTFAYLRQLHNSAPNGNPAVYWVDARVIAGQKGK